MASPQPKLLDQVRAVLRGKHFSRRTEESYVHWITRYVRFHQTRHPRELGSAEISAFLTHLAVDLQVAAATQNQARSAWLFLYREVLGRPIDAPRDVVAARTPHRLATVLTKDEVRRVLTVLSGDYRLMAQLAGSGESGGASGRNHQTGQLPHLSAQFRDPSARKRLRYPHGAGAPRAQR